MSSFQESGFEFLSDFFSFEEMIDVDKEISHVEFDCLKGGFRNAEKKFSSINKLVNSTKLFKKAEDYLEGTPKIVRVILFNKSLKNNWIVPWHQDCTVAVSKKFDLKGWGPWSVKDGLYHVQPPLECLNDMVAFRIHIDDTTKENGSLRILPNSHRFGIMTSDEIGYYVKHNSFLSCELKCGSVLALRPLLLHSSQKTKVNTNRKTIHVEFSRYQLPNDINWA